MRNKFRYHSNIPGGTLNKTAKTSIAAFFAALLMLGNQASPALAVAPPTIAIDSPTVASVSQI